MVKIIDGWFYSVDDNEYILLHEYEYEGIDWNTKEKTGEIKTKFVERGYFTSLSVMLETLTVLLAKEKIYNGEITTIQQHIEQLRKIKDELESIILPF